jgi:hypothetical protein
MSNEAAMRLGRWIHYLGNDATDADLDNAIKHWELGEEPPLAENKDQ